MFEMTTSGMNSQIEAGQATRIQIIGGTNVAVCYCNNGNNSELSVFKDGNLFRLQPSFVVVGHILIVYRI